MSHTVMFEKPESASATVNRPSTAPVVIETKTSAPLGSGWVISPQMVAAKRHSRAHRFGSKPACGHSQTAAASASGTSQRQ